MPTSSPSRRLALAALLLTAACAGGEPSDIDPPTHYVRVVGIVRDIQGEPVPTVSAELGPDSGFSFARQITDDDGEYVLTADATFSSVPAPDSTTLKLRFYPTMGRHRDSLLLELSVRLPVVSVELPAEPVTRNVTVTLP